MRSNWLVWLIVMGLLVGCRTQEPPTDETEEAAATESVDETTLSQDEVTPDEEPTTAEEQADVTEKAEPAQVAEERAADEPAEPSIEGYDQQIREALTNGDRDAALAVLSQAWTDFPDHADFSVSLISLRLSRDNALEDGDKETAVAAFKETAQIARDVFGQDPIPDRYAPLWYTSLYNEARALAHEDQTEAAIAAFRTAVEAGLHDLDKINSDSFLAPLSDELRGVIREVARQELAEADSFEFDFELPNLDGEPVKLADFQGKVVIVDIWGTWCPPCRAEIPHFIQLQDTYADDLAIVGINYEGGEPEEAIEKIRNFIEEQGMNYACVIGDEETRNQIPEFRGFPTTLFLDREGNVRLKVVGYHAYNKLDAYVAELIGSSSEAVN